jgi:ATP-binding cassette subfamily B protein
MAGTGVDTGQAPVAWIEHRGKAVSIHAAPGGYAVTVAERELHEAERVVTTLTELLRPEGGAPAPHIDLYLLDPVVGGDEPADESGNGSCQRAGGIGSGGIVRVVQGEQAGDPVASAVARFLVAHWFGDGAVRAAAFVEGAGGLAAARAGVGPDVARADQWVRGELAAGRPVSVVVPARSPGPGRLFASTSFLSYLVQSFGAPSIGRFLARYQPDRRDEAAVAVFQRPLGALEEAWLASMGRGDRGDGRGRNIRYFLMLLAPYRLRYAELLSYFLFVALTGVVLPKVTGCVVSELGRLQQVKGPQFQDPRYLELVRDGVVKLPAPPKGVCGVVVGSSNEVLGSSLTVPRIAVIVLALVALYVVDGLLALRRAGVSNTIFRGIGVSLQEQIFNKLQRLSHRFYGTATVGDLSARLINDARLLSEAMGRLFNQGMLMFLTLVVAMIAVLAENPRVGLVLFVVLPVFMVVRRKASPRMASAFGAVQQLNAEALAVAQENLSAHSVVKAFGLEGRAQSALAARLRATVAANLRQARATQLLETSLTMTTNVGQLAVIGVAGALALSGRANAGELVTLTLLVARMVGPLSVLASIETALQEGGVAIQRINQVLDEPVDIEDRPGAQALAPLAKEVTLEGVIFSYGGGRPVLSGLDLVIPAGASVAVVGPSGSGKSTIVNLLLRFWDPQQGRVTFDGVDLRDVTLSSLRAQIGLVFQDTFVFNTTLRENIAIGQPGAGDAEVEAAAQAAQLGDYVQTLPAGFDTVLGERGVRMSGGQRQRLAIARTLLRNPPILILDEATSALDAHTEAEILETLAEVAKHRTTISITHRLSMAATADLVVVLDQGRVVEQGPHAQLVGAGGLYQKLYEEQTTHVTAAGRPRIGLQAYRLRTIPLFTGLGSEALADLSDQLVMQEYQPGQDIVRQGEPGDKLYVLGRGEADVFVGDGDGERRVNRLVEGDYFGELALLTGQPRSATVRAVAPTEAYGLGVGDFLALVEREPSVRQQLSQLTSQRRAAYDAAALAAGIAAAERRSRTAPAPT